MLRAISERDTRNSSGGDTSWSVLYLGSGDTGVSSNGQENILHLLHIAGDIDS